MLTTLFNNTNNRSSFTIAVRSRTGFALIEVMIVGVVLAILGLTTANIVSNSSKAQRGLQAKDQQREITAEIRSMLNDRTACLNSFGGLNPVTGADTPASGVIDSTNVPRFRIDDIDKSGLLKYKQFRVQDYAADLTVPPPLKEGKGVLFIRMEKTGQFIGSREIANQISIQFRLNAANQIIDCFAFGSMYDGFWQIGTNAQTNIFYSGGNVGLGTASPTAQLHVVGSSPAAFPAISGSTPSGLMARLQSPSSATLDIGSGSVSGAWLQSTDKTNLSINYPLFLNPNGGNVGIGTKTPQFNLSVQMDQNNGTEIGVLNFTSDTAASAKLIAKTSLNSTSAQINIEAYSPGYTFASSRPFQRPNGVTLVSNSFTSGGMAIASLGGDITFHAGGSSETTRFTSDGKIGIGTASPAFLVHARTDQDDKTALVVENANATLAASAKIQVNANVAGAALSAYSSAAPSFGYIRPNSVALFTNTLTSGGLSLAAESPVGVISFHAGGGNEKMRIDSTGNIGIGTSSPGYKLDVSGTINIAAGFVLAFGGTTVCTAAGCTASSDERLKENIKPLDFDLNKLLSLNAVEYDWKNKAKYGDKHQIGFIAQQLEQVYPEVVYTDKNTGLKSVTYDHLVAPMIEALKILYKRILDIEDYHRTQDRQIAELNDKVKELDAVKAENAEKSKQIDALKAYLCSQDPKASICK